MLYTVPHKKRSIFILDVLAYILFSNRNRLDLLPQMRQSMIFQVEMVCRPDLDLFLSGTYPYITHNRKRKPLVKNGVKR